MNPFQKKSGPPPMPKRGGAPAPAKEAMPASVETPKAPAPEVAAPTAPEPTPMPQSDIPPEAVCFRDSRQTCGNCMSYSEDGSCQYGMPTDGPGASCNLHSDREDGASDMEMPSL